MNEMILEIYKHLNECDEKSARNIYYGMELFTNCFDDGLVFLQNQIQFLAKSGDYDEIDKANSFCKKIKQIQVEMSQVLDRMVSLTQENDDIDVEEQDLDIEIAAQNIDYSRFVVDTNEKHSLDENFEHKRPYGYMLLEKKYCADNWQKILVSVCAELAKINHGLLESFVNNPMFQGRKVKYFGTAPEKRKNKKIPGTQLYVWINLSANGIKQLIRKMLVEFGIKPSTFYIYLRADYSDLHMKDSKDFDDNGMSEPMSSDMKIGRYVRNVMRELADKNYHFSAEELGALLDKEKTKRLFGIRLPFFKKVDPNANIDVQRMDHTGNYRYWKEVYKFNGKSFLICSQWFEYNRERFEKWLLKIKEMG